MLRERVEVLGVEEVAEVSRYGGRMHVKEAGGHLLFRGGRRGGWGDCGCCGGGGGRVVLKWGAQMMFISSIAKK